MREPCDYTCPVCGESLGTSIDWDPVDWDTWDQGYQVGSCACVCGVEVRFVDHIKIIETEVKVIE